MDDVPPPAVWQRLLRWLMRRQAGTRPCMSWPLDDKQRQETENAAGEIARRH